jgi:hypothetical protein
MVTSSLVRSDWEGTGERGHHRYAPSQTVSPGAIPFPLDRQQPNPCHPPFQKDREQFK